MFHGPNSNQPGKPPQLQKRNRFGEIENATADRVLKLIHDKPQGCPAYGEVDRAGYSDYVRKALDGNASPADVLKACLSSPRIYCPGVGF